MDELKVLGKFLSALAVIVGGIALTANSFLKYQCNNYKRLTEQEVKYIAFDTCYVKTPKGWMRWDEYISRATTNE